MQATSRQSGLGDERVVRVVALTDLEEVTLALDATKVRRVLESEEVAGWTGVCHDLPRWLGLAVDGAGRRALAVDHDGHEVAVLLGHAIRFEELPVDAIGPLPAFVRGMVETGGANGVIEREGRLIVSLDTDRVLGLCREQATRGSGGAHGRG